MMYLIPTALNIILFILWLRSEKKRKQCEEAYHRLKIRLHVLNYGNPP